MNPLNRAALAILVVAGCPKRDDLTGSVVPRDVSVKAAAPGPLEAKPFQAPKVETRKLSNGVQVFVATNQEVPLVNLTVAFRVGAWHEASPGVAALTFDLMNDGAGDMTAEDISKKLKALASDLGTSAGVDGASVSVSSLSRNLPPTLDILEQVIKRPTFPQEEWDLVRPRYVTALQAARKDPSAIAGRVDGRLLYGDAYRGRITMEADYAKLTVNDFKKFHATHVGPENAIILVGGAITADQAVALLEPRLGNWRPTGIVTPPTAVTPLPIDKPVLYLVDKPGAAQSVISARTFVGQATDPDWYAMDLGVDVLGGTFMSRMNLNLREDKGYTYGARCGTDVRFGPSVASCSASVQTAVTGPALVEMKKELAQIQSERPISESELVYMKDTIVNGYATRFETSGALLGEQTTIWRYSLPADLPDTYIPNVQKVDVASAQAALKARWSLDRTVWLVVGDKSKIEADLKAFGLPIVELDADGRPVGG